MYKNSDYVLPDKELLEKRSKELSNENKYYSLSKLTFKKDLKAELVVPVGINNEKVKYYMDLKHVSGIFIEGETGSGKSVFIDSIIISLLLKNTPDELRLLCIDPKIVELKAYEELPHLMSYVISDFKKGKVWLTGISNLIKEREDILKAKNIKEIDSLNTGEKLPHVIVFIDESFDLINEEETKQVLKEILKKGDKLGVHLIMATNSYLKNGYDKSLLKLFPYVFTFDLSSKEQSKLINIEGADLLTVYGEAFVNIRNKDIIRVQTPYTSEKDIKEVIKFIKENN